MAGFKVWVVSIPMELDKELRNIIAMRNQAANNGSFKRGDLKAAAIEALKDWARKQNQELMLSGNTKR